MVCSALLPHRIFSSLFQMIMAGETCLRTGIIPRCSFRRLMRWQAGACGFRIITLFRFVVLLGHACLPDSTPQKTACGVAPVVSRSGHPAGGKFARWRPPPSPPEEAKAPRWDACPRKAQRLLGIQLRLVGQLLGYSGRVRERFRHRSSKFIARRTLDARALMKTKMTNNTFL